MLTRPVTLAATVLALALWAIPHSANAIIIVTPIPDQVLPRHPVYLVKQDVDVHLTDRAAEVSVECTYYNSTNFRLEGEWIFPLPPEAAVDKFTMFVGDEEIKAELLDATEARQIYESIVSQMRDPALLEYAGRQLLKSRVYPIEPLSEASIKLYYTHPLNADFGTTDFVFPILDESWGSPRNGELGTDSKSQMTVGLATTAPLKGITSPTHDISIDDLTDHSATVHCSAEVLRQKGDFHLLCTYDTREVSAQFLTTINDDGRYFMGIIAPGNAEGMEVMGKDVVFCFDHSGSMKGEKIQQARAALKFCLESLNSKDRFGLITFNDGLDVFREGLVDASTAETRAAVNRVDAMEADGGTFIYGALDRSLKFFGAGQRPRYLVFLTDGLPTIGITNADQILRMVKAGNSADARLFTFGVGYDLNAGLLNDLADQNHGFSSYVAPEEDVEVSVSNFFRKMSRPVLADCRLDFAGDVEVMDVYPSTFPDIFAGNEILVLGRFRGEGEVNAHLHGRRGDTPVDHVFTSEFTPERKAYPFVAKLWAGRRIGYLLEQIRLSGETAEVKDEVVRLSKKYGIMTPYTSFLAAPEEVRIAMEQNQPRDRLVPSPQSSSGSAGAAPSDQSLQRRSMEASRLKAGSAASYALPQIATDAGAGKKEVDVSVSGRRLTLLNGVWTDWNVSQQAGTIKDTLTIKPYSPAYFRLASTPEIAAILAVGDKVIFLWRNTLIRIDETGESAWNPRWSSLL